MRHDDYWYVELEFALWEHYWRVEEEKDEPSVPGVFRVISCLPMEQRIASMLPDEPCSQLQPVKFFWGSCIEAMDYEELHQIENDVEDFHDDCRSQTEQVWG